MNPRVAALPLASQAQRPKTAPFFLLPSVVLTGIAYMGGGNPTLSDMGFLWMTLCCVFFLLIELKHFKTRQGWGAATFYFGVLIWFAHDYMTHWYQCNWALWPPEYMPTVGKMAFLYCLFITLMAFGMTLPVKDGAVRFLLRYPEPNTLEILFWFALITLVINIGYEACFSYADLITTFKSRYFGGRQGQIGTSLGGLGAINTSFTAYVTMFSMVVNIGAIAGIAYAFFSPRATRWKQLLMALIWCHSFMLGFGGGTRTALLGVLAPLIAFLVVKSLRQPTFFKKVLPFILVGAAVTFVMMQVQTHNRMDRNGFNLEDAQDEKNLSKIEGNTMFSEALDDYIRIPDEKPFFYSDYPVEGAVRAIPEMFFWFAIAPVPRPGLALLGIEKPIDKAWSWRARAGDTSGATNVINGTTCSYGLIGAWYFRFGLIGMMEGAILMGWLYAWTERLIRSATLGSLRLMTLIIGFLMLSTLFFFSRDIVFPAIWPPILLFIALAWLIKAKIPHH